MSDFGPFKLENWSIRKLFMLALFVHLLTSIFSEGFFQFDEHFQILEFLNHKLNGSPAGDLPWEFHSKIRPWFQVYLYYLIIYPLKAMGLTSPFIQAAVLRFLTGVLGLYSIYSLKSFFEEDSKILKVIIVLMCFSWFVPIIHVRASSESLSASLILIGFSFLMASLKKENFSLGFFSGLLLGFGYLAKAQLAIAVAFLWFWLVVFYPKKWKASLSSSLAIIFTIFLGVIIDYWGYGEWTFTPLNYFKINIIEDRVSSFGVDPWWYYFKFIFLKGIPIVSLPFIIGTIVFWKRYWKNPVTWMTAPFFLIHCFIGHKELRFIFLIVLFAPYMLAKILDDFELLSSKWTKAFLYLNIAILIPVMFKSANSSIRFFKHVESKNIKEIYAHGEDPYSMVGLKMNFYRPKNLEIKVFQNAPIESEGYFFFKSGSRYFEYLKYKNCRLDYLSYPSWSLSFNFGNWIERSRVWSLWKCSKKVDAQSPSS